MQTLPRIAQRNVLQHWRHSLTAIISIAAAFVSLAMFGGYMLGVENLYEETFTRRAMYGHVLIEAQGAQSAEGRTNRWNYVLGDKEQQFLEEFLAKEKDTSGTPTIVARARFLSIDGLLTNGTTSTIFIGYGYDLKEGAQIRGRAWDWNTTVGVPLDRYAHGPGILLGQTLGKIVDCVPEKKVSLVNGVGGYTPIERPFHCARPLLQLNVTTQSGQVNALELPVAGLLDGVYREIDMRLVTMGLPEAQQLMGNRAVSYYGIELRRPDQAASFLERLHNESQARGLKIEGRRWRDHIFGDMFVRTMDLLSIFRNFVVITILAVAGLSILTTFFKIVKERTREIGTMRSFGFTARQIVALFALEASLMSTAGIAIGAAIAFFSSLALNHAGILYKAGVLAEPVPFVVAFSPLVYVQSAVILSILAVGAATVSARQTARRKIAECLIHV